MSDSDNNEDNPFERYVNSISLAPARIDTDRFYEAVTKLEMVLEDFSHAATRAALAMGMIQLDADQGCNA